MAQPGTSKNLKVLLLAPLTAVADAKHPFKRQIHTIHVVAVAGTVEQSQQCISSCGSPLQGYVCERHKMSKSVQFKLHGSHNTTSRYGL